MLVEKLCKHSCLRQFSLYVISSVAHFILYCILFCLFKKLYCIMADAVYNDSSTSENKLISINRLLI